MTVFRGDTMDVKDSNDKRLQQIMDAICEEAEVIFLINKKERTYKMLRKNRYWQALMNEKGTWKELYATVFVQNALGQDPYKENQYGNNRK